MRIPFQGETLCPSGADGLCTKYLLLAVAAAWLLCGCVSKVQIPAVAQFHFVSVDEQAGIDVAANQEILLHNLFQLIKANEGVEVPICTAELDTRQCVKDGVSFFVFGGGIPGLGSRRCCVFSDVALKGDHLEFSKDNRSTKFIGTPMAARANTCQVHVKNGGLQVEMTNYYANWAGIGHTFMAEGWAIDYMDIDKGVVGMQLELDVKGILVAGGGSRYVLLTFPTIPADELKPLISDLTK